MILTEANVFAHLAKEYDRWRYIYIELVLHLHQLPVTIMTIARICDTYRISLNK